jgi:hypothetical protein
MGDEVRQEMASWRIYAFSTCHGYEFCVRFKGLKLINLKQYSQLIL